MAFGSDFDTTDGKWRFARRAALGRRSFGALLWIVSLAAISPAWGANPSTLCDRAAQMAAARTGVPISVLKAISLTETGRRRDGAMRPWPWTVNMEGKGVWFDDPHAALTYVGRHHRAGARSFDVGCFQLNYKWHGRNFASIEQMIQPEQNALYAARFLLDLYAEKGNWSAAAGAYHSRTRKFSDRYRKRFDTFRAALRNEDGSGAAAPIATRHARADSAPATGKLAPALRVNLYPLLQAGEARRGLGSLVPVTSAADAGLFAGSSQRLIR